MTKATMIKYYRNNSAADSYIVGFTFKHMLYMIETSEIMPRFLSVEAASRNQGENLRLRVKCAQCEKFVKKGAVCLGPDSLLTADKYNKGELFEKIVTEYYGQEWEKDNVPFWVQGDINVDGKEIQIKLNGATLLNTKQIEKNFKKVSKRG